MSTFERYDEAAAFYDGTRVPVGLAIVREIAERHGGNVRAVPAATGARFELDLPAAA